MDSQPSVDESKKEEDETSEEVEGRRWNPKLSVIPGSPYVTITKDTDLQEYLGGDYIAKGRCRTAYGNGHNCRKKDSLEIAIWK